jgi:hypothetical protein
MHFIRRHFSGTPTVRSVNAVYDYIGAKDNKIYSLAAGRSKVLPSREHDGNTGYLKSEAVAHSSELLP